MGNGLMVAVHGYKAATKPLRRTVNVLHPLTYKIVYRC